jgi:hypothetical protein
MTTTHDWDDSLEEQEAINELNRTSPGHPVQASNPTRAIRPSPVTPTPKAGNANPAVVSENAEMWNLATALSRADIIPKQYQGSPANVFVALDMAKRLGCGSMEIMQNTFVVHGTPGFSSKYIIGMANQKGPFTGPIHFAYTPGTNPSVTASAIVSATGERVEMTADMAMAKAEGWSKNKKYQTMPQLMLSYRAGTLLVRLYCPEVLLGLQTTEELQDVHAARTIDATIVSTALDKQEARLAPPEPEEKAKAPVDPENAPDDLSYHPKPAAENPDSLYDDD